MNDIERIKQLEDLANRHPDFAQESDEDDRGVELMLIALQRFLGDYLFVRLCMRIVESEKQGKAIKQYLNGLLLKDILFEKAALAVSN